MERSIVVMLNSTDYIYTFVSWRVIPKWKDPRSSGLPVAAVSVGWLSVWHVAPEIVWRTLWLPLCPQGRTGWNPALHRETPPPSGMPQLWPLNRDMRFVQLESVTEALTVTYQERPQHMSMPVSMSRRQLRYWCFEDPLSSLKWARLLFDQNGPVMVPLRAS